MKPPVAAGGFCFWWTGKKLPRHCHPHQFLLKSFGFPGAKTAKKRFLLWEMGFFAAKIVPCPPYMPPGTIGGSREPKPSRALLVFRQIELPARCGRLLYAPKHLACILKQPLLNTFRRGCGAPGAIRTRGLPLRSRPDTMKPGATQCKKILGNTRFFTVSNPIWYHAS